ncbi:uncharacterized protein LOC135947075 isoform X2 [Cloeon dipterum]
MGNATRQQSIITSTISTIAVTKNYNSDVGFSASFPGKAVDPTGSSAYSQASNPSSTNVNAALSGEGNGADSFISEGTGSTAFQESGSATTSMSKTSSLVERASGDSTDGLDTNLSSLANDFFTNSTNNNKEVASQSATTVGINSGLSSPPASFTKNNAGAGTTTSIKSIINALTTANPINPASGITIRTASTAVPPGTSQSTKLGTSTTTIQATTTSPSCRVTCADFNNSLTQSQSSQPAGSVKTAATCSRQYFVSTSSVARNKATLGCKALSMTLLTTTSLEEINCLANSFKGTFWTGGSSEGINCKGEKQYAWCSTGHLMSPSLLSMAKFWLSTNAMAINTVGKCLALTILDSTNKGMVHKKCDDVLPFVCQFSTDCPQQCDKNPSLFDSNGNLKNKTSYGTWIDIGNTTYLLGNKPMSWLSSWKQCCALGMEMLNIENTAEQRGLTSLTVGQNKKMWKANFNYWTSGTWNGAPAGQWSWCKTTGPTILDKNIIWERGQPDNKGGNESCIHFRFVLNSTGTILTDRNCDSKFVFACKTSLLTTTAKPCIASCPPINTCQRNPLLFSNTKSLIDFTSYGEWYDACGRTVLMYTKTKSDWTNAWKQCCAVGLNLTSTESAGKLSCFSRIVTKFAPKTYGDFWLAGTDVGCPSTFRWCPLNRNFINPELSWKEGHPKEGLDCVYLEARNGSVLLATANCTEQKFFFCDLIKVAASSQRAIQNECADIWDITSEQIDNLLISSFFNSLNITQNLRCFLKCIGVNLGMFELGGVNGIDLLRQIELAAEEDPVQMQNGFNAYDTCSGKKFDDECVTAEEIYKCGLQEAPDLVTKIVNNNNNNDSMLTPPLPCVPKPRSCWLSNLYPCIANQTAIDEINKNGTDEMGRVFPSPSGKSFYIGRVKTTGIDVVAVFQRCCALGMRLFEPASSADFKTAYGASTSLDYYTKSAYLMGDTESINQTHEVWCRSRKVLPDALYSTTLAVPRFPCTESIMGATTSFSYAVVSRSNENIHNLYINRANINDFVSFICEKV